MRPVTRRGGRRHWATNGHVNDMPAGPAATHFETPCSSLISNFCRRTLPYWSVWVNLVTLDGVSLSPPVTVLVRLIDLFSLNLVRLPGPVAVLAYCPTCERWAVLRLSP